MTEKLKQIIKEEVGKLSKEAQEAINAFDWAGIVEKIGAKYLLNESEINDLQVETLLVMLSMTSMEFYEINIENHVGTTRDEAAQIVREVVSEIFNPILNTIQENIKKNLKNRNVTAVQNMNFILSGGDYSVFLEEASNNNSDTQRTDKLLGTSNILEVKDRLIN
jgi:cobalamin biosynthesis protein CbiD